MEQLKMDQLNMLWIDDDAELMSDVAEGFIRYLKEQDRTPKVIHEWLKLGNHYQSRGKEKNELSKDAENFLTMVDGDKFGVNEQYLLENEKIDDAVKAIIAAYDIVAIDLALMNGDTDITSFNRKEPKKLLSMVLYNKLQNAKSNKEKPIVVILYSSHAIDGRLDELWNESYDHFYGPIDGVNKRYVYMRKTLSKNPNTFRVYCADILIDTIYYYQKTKIA